NRAAMSSGQQMSILRDSIKSGAIDVPLGSALLDGVASQPPEQSESRREMLALVELRRKTRQIQVSTDDREVRAYLRQLGEPICLFGEDAADRRERLKTLIVLHGESAIRKRPAGASDSAGDSEAAASTAGASTSASGAAINKELWYHEGPEALKLANPMSSEFIGGSTNEELLESVRSQASKASQLLESIGPEPALPSDLFECLSIALERRRAAIEQELADWRRRQSQLQKAVQEASSANLSSLSVAELCRIEAELDAAIDSDRNAVRILGFWNASDVDRKTADLIESLRIQWEAPAGK
ncbi:hypothetical protein BOX15_Mlig008323g2, partial [Macrostomum lignano]